MSDHVSIHPPNSLILVRDADSFEVPGSLGTRLVDATASCVAIGTLAEPDGLTSVWFGDEDDSLPVEAFAGELSVPSGRVVVSTVTHEILLTTSVGRQRVPLRVLTNDAAEPDEIAIVVG